MTHQLPQLSYSYDALEPHIDAQTMEIHHTKHHQAYVNNLNNLIVNTEFADSSLEEIIKKATGPTFNNAAQIWNHTFYFESLALEKEINGEIAAAINQSFNSFESFKEKFTEAAKTLFGSGWVWLVKKDSNLEIIQTNNADNPLRENLTLLLTLDVWEHAYYLKYQNKRPEYIEAFFNIINWDKVNERLIK